MKQTQELEDFWADIESLVQSTDSSLPFVSPETASVFQNHLEKLQPIADSENGHAKYAIASIYLLELLYTDEIVRESRFANDCKLMTELLAECAQSGMTAAFDSLSVVGTGKLGSSARKAVESYECIQKPDWDDVAQLPIYSEDWMAGAMKLWTSGMAGD